MFTLCVSTSACSGGGAERYQLSSQLTPPLSLSTTLLSQQLAPCLVLLCLSSWGKQTWCWYQRAISEIWHNYTHHQCTSHRTLLSPNKAGWQSLSLANMAPSPVLSPLYVPPTVKVGIWMDAKQCGKRLPLLSDIVQQAFQSYRNINTASLWAHLTRL